jgi:hypothetical protein
MLKTGFSVPEVFLATGLANAVVTGTVFIAVPEYWRRCLAVLRRVRA